MLYNKLLKYTPPAKAGSAGLSKLRLASPLARRYALAGSNMVKKQSLEKLSDIIEEASSKDTHMFYRNSFALACYLAEQGNVTAAKKHLSYLFRVLGRNNRSVYFGQISDSLEEYAAEYAREISANSEINKLFK